MKLLVLGGSVFLSRAVAAEAVARGHAVTCACRSASVPEGARHVRLDRSLHDPVDEGYDAVVDVGRAPSFVRAAVAAIPDAHWVFVSTINVYDDATGELVEPEPLDVDPAVDNGYGRMKVACEELVSDGIESCTIVRPGLIVGPGDPTGRFTYWMARLGAAAQDGEVLAPGDPGDVVQVIDVRDLAAWIVTAAETRLNTTCDGVGQKQPIGDVLAEVADGVGASPRWTWVDQDFLVGADVAPWAGPGSVPLWLPRPEYDAMMSHDSPVPTRPVTDTARDTLAWLQATDDAPVTGITREQERALLEQWHSLRT